MSNKERQKKLSLGRESSFQTDQLLKRFWKGFWKNPKVVIKTKKPHFLHKLLSLRLGTIFKAVTESALFCIIVNR